MDFVTPLLYRLCPCVPLLHGTIVRNQTAPVFMTVAVPACLVKITTAVLADSCSLTEKGHWPLRGVSSHFCQAISHSFALSMPCFWIWGGVRVHRLGTGCPVGLLWGHPCCCHWPQNCAWSVTLINSLFPQGELRFVVVTSWGGRKTAVPPSGWRFFPQVSPTFAPSTFSPSSPSSHPSAFRSHVFYCPLLLELFSRTPF